MRWRGRDQISGNYQGELEGPSQMVHMFVIRSSGGNINQQIAEQRGLFSVVS